MTRMIAQMGDSSRRIGAGDKIRCDKCAEMGRLQNKVRDAIAHPARWAASRTFRARTPGGAQRPRGGRNLGLDAT